MATNEEAAFAAASETLRQYLAENGMRRTPERTAVLRELYAHKNTAVTAEEIYERLDAAFHVSRATIYASLDLFVMLGLAVRTTLRPAVTYTPTFGRRDHCFQYCTHCGGITSIDMPHVSRGITNTTLTRFRAESVAVTLFGICSKCQASITRQRRKAEAKAKNNTKHNTKK